MAKRSIVWKIFGLLWRFDPSKDIKADLIFYVPVIK